MIRPATTPPHLVTIVLLTATSTLTLNMFLPSLSGMAEDFEVSYGLISLSVAGYLGITAVLQLILGPLSDRYGRRPVLLGAVAVFATASVGCTLAPDAYTFLAFRLLQGGIISGWAISQAIIRDQYDAQSSASLLGYISMAMAVGPMLAPIIGGALDQAFGWRATFMLYTTLGLVLMFLIWSDLGETNHNRTETLTAQIKDYPTLLQSRRFWGYAGCTAFSTASFYAFLAGVPLVAVADLGLEPAEIGVYIGSITGGFAFGSFLSGRYSKRFELTTMMMAGRVLACTGLTLGLIAVLLGWTSVAVVFSATLCVGLGNGITMPSANAGAISMRPKLTGSAAGLMGSATVATGAVVTTVTGFLVSLGNGPAILLSMMLLCAGIALLATLMVMRINQRDGNPIAAER